MSKQEQALEVKKESSLSTDVEKFDVGGFIQGGIDITDIKVPKALIVQPMSTVKRENKSLKDGDLFISTSKKAILEVGQIIEFTPIFVEKLLQTFENETKIPTYEGAKKGDWINTEAVNNSNKNLPEIDEGYVRRRIMACYSLFHTPDLPSILPVRLDFRGSSKNAFQVIMEKVIAYAESGKAQSMAHPQLELAFELTVVEKVNQKNQAFYVLEPSFSRLTTEEEQMKALKLLDMVKSLSEDDKYNDADLVNYAD